MFLLHHAHLQSHLAVVVIIFTYNNKDKHCNEFFCFSKEFRKHNVLVLSDEIYARVTFDDTFISISKVSTALQEAVTYV